ncbi:MAG: hypothetical protein IJZ10_11615 [Thermoguttaceae bacterium]|nr:hypothetical protein [Thermoguttaceae bacterium]
MNEKQTLPAPFWRKSGAGDNDIKRKTDAAFVEVDESGSPPADALCGAARA